MEGCGWICTLNKPAIRTDLEEGGREKRVVHTDLVRMVFQYSKILEVERKMQSLFAEFFWGLIMFAIAFVMRKSACAWRLSVMRRRSPGRGARARAKDMLSIEVPKSKCQVPRVPGAEGAGVADGTRPNRMMPMRKRESRMTHGIYIELVIWLQQLNKQLQLLNSIKPLVRPSHSPQFWSSTSTSTTTTMASTSSSSSTITGQSSRFADG